MSKAELKSVAKSEEKKDVEKTKERKPLPPFSFRLPNGKGRFKGTIVVDLRKHRIPNVQLFPDPLDWLRTTVASLQPIVKEMESLTVKVGEETKPATAKERRKFWKDLDSLVRARKAAENLDTAVLTDVVMGKVNSGDMTKEEIDKLLLMLNAAKSAKA